MGPPLETYTLYVGRLPVEERDRYCVESARIGRLIGVPDDFLPTTVATLQAYVERMLGGGEIVVTETARALAHELLYPPTLVVGGPLLRLVRLTTVGLLPPRIRQAYGLPWERRHETSLRRSAHLFRSLLPWLPCWLRHWPQARAAFRGRDPASLSQAPGKVPSYDGYSLPSGRSTPRRSGGGPGATGAAAEVSPG